MKFISSFEQDISRVGAANKRNILFNAEIDFIFPSNVQYSVYLINTVINKEQFIRFFPVAKNKCAVQMSVSITV